MNFKRITSIILVIQLLVCLCGCNDYDEQAYSYSETEENDNYITVNTDEYDSSDTWAFYWYLCGSDLESEYGFATEDLGEMLCADLSENVTVVIETGGAYEWDGDISSDCNTRFVYDSEDLFIIEEIPSANMGDKGTLENFLKFCNENYPADNQAVMFWNHGGGSVQGVAFDELYDYDSLSLPEIGQAFEKIPAKSGKYEMIGFDTCLMATIDVVATCGDYANYLVASEELEPGSGWDYETIFQTISDNPSMDGAQLGKVICDSYYEACEYDGTEDMVTLSVIDLSMSDDLVSAYNNIGTEALMSAGISPSYLGSFSRAAKSAENYGGNNNLEGYSNMVDLGDLVRQAGNKLLPDTGAALLSALNDAVVYQVNGSLRSNASGLSCYYNYNGDYDNYTEFAQLNTSPAFQYYFDYMLSGEISDELLDYIENGNDLYSDEQFVPEEISDMQKGYLEDFPIEITDDGNAVLNLGKDIADNLAGVYITVAYVDEQEGVSVLLGFDNDLDADWENGIFTDNFRGVWGSIDGSFVYMELSDEADDYQVYAIPVLLNGEEYTLLVSYIYSTEKFEILGFRSGIDENGMANGKIRPLIPGDIIEPLLYALDLETDEMIQTSVDKITVTDETAFYESDMGDGEFLFMFEMVDIQNNSYLSEVIFITVEDQDIYLYK